MKIPIKINNKLIIINLRGTKVSKYSVKPSKKLYKREKKVKQEDLE